MICRERPERGGLGQGDFERAELAGGFRRSRECLGWAGLQGKVQPRAGSVGLGNGEGGSGKSQRKHKGRKNTPGELPTRSERIVKRKMGKRFGEKKSCFAQQRLLVPRCSRKREGEAAGSLWADAEQLLRGTAG